MVVVFYGVRYFYLLENLDNMDMVEDKKEIESEQDEFKKRLEELRLMKHEMDELFQTITNNTKVMMEKMKESIALTEKKDKKLIVG